MGNNINAPGIRVPTYRISDDLLAKVNDAWNIECMEAHGTEGRSVDYIGSRRVGSKVYDYYQDDAGAFWYGTRGIVNGEIVSMEKYLFGHEVKKRNRRKARQR